MTWLYFERETDLFDGCDKQVLHVAPEPQFQKLLRKRIGAGYLTADLYDPAAMVTMDVTDIQFPDDSFDVVYCSHVLEHVDDDRQAMREFFRVLKPAGWAILAVPISADATIEDASITDPAERLRLFGQVDHVRRYGPDYVDRLRSVGYHVVVAGPEDFLTIEEMKSIGVGADTGEQIFFCSKS
ncbi:methyltransferase domain-containing protein [Mycolicibacterium hodleri]|uniref:methyltransferase domain-containing protein n=1 Tax=Mycolicibacterium hodleri TaxID=49897 RepID=UPI001960FCC0|nr:class I SAM-dependent methyltransferase [Mycolicibacterium hodleri]